MTTLAALQDQLNAIQLQIDGMKAAGEREWPQDGDAVWWKLLDGCSWQDEWVGTASQKAALIQGNIFRTDAEATRERDRCALITELRRHPKACEYREGALWLSYSPIAKIWLWSLAEWEDHTPASGYYSEKVEGLIEQYGSRLDLLLGA